MITSTPFTDSLFTGIALPEDPALAAGCEEGDFDGAAVEALAVAVCPVTGHALADVER